MTAPSVRPRVAVLGSLNMDLVVRAPRFPEPGETLLGGPFATFPGGKGANQAAAAARQGAATALIGCVGNDAHGAALLAALVREGVDVARVEVHDGVATGVAVITLDARGENHIVVSPGANAEVGAAEVDAARDALTGAGVLVAQLETPLAAFERAAGLAREAGAVVLLNAAPARELSPELLELVDVLVVNRGEAEELAADLTTGRGRDSRELAAALAARGPRIVVLTLGPRGALAYEREGGRFTEQQAFTVQACDSTGAGDAFVGTLAVGLAEGRPLERALERAAAAGALACTRAGALPSLPTAVEVDAMLAAQSPG